MDAHVFRLLAKELAHFMHGARVEKIHSPAPGISAFSLYSHGLKRIIIIRHHKTYNHGLKCSTDLRQSKVPPALYLSSHKLPNPAQPGTLAMTLRKYLSGRRLGASTLDWLNRRIFFFVPQAAHAAHSIGNMAGTPLWLCLDLISGPSLHHELPDISEAQWPDQNFFGPDIKTTLQNPSVWKNFPVLTPALRNTLACLDNQEAAALLADLQYEAEQNSGTLHLYNFNNTPQILSAWPLPEKLTEDLQEVPLHTEPETAECAEIPLFPMLESAKAVYEPQILANWGIREQKENQMNFSAKEKHLQKTLLKLSQEDIRLKQLVALREQGILLQSMLWRLSPEEKNEKLATISIPETTQEITLDPRLSIRENMNNFFKQAERGLRGLRFVSERRAIITEELEQLHSGFHPEQIKKIPQNMPTAKKERSKTDMLKTARLIQRFISSDGFVLLRGRSSTGNQALLKLAQAHDLWLHVNGGPSAHVVIRREHLEQDIPQQTLLEAGTLSAVKSWKKTDSKAEIISALVKNVRPVKDGAPGSVLVDKIKLSFMVPVDHELETRLLPPAGLEPLSRIQNVKALK